MEPALRPGRIVVCRSWFKHLKIGQIVVINHAGLQKIKRIAKLDPVKGSVYVLGDNQEASTDSRDFGWIAMSNIVAVVIWPLCDQTVTSQARIDHN